MYHSGLVVLGVLPTAPLCGSTTNFLFVPSLIFTVVIPMIDIFVDFRNSMSAGRNKVFINYKLINNQTKHRYRISFTKKSGSTFPGTGSADPDPHQNEADPKHWEMYEAKVVVNGSSYGSKICYFIFLCEKLWR